MAIIFAITMDVIKVLQINSISNHTKRHIRGSAMSAMSMTVTIHIPVLYL